MKMTVQYWKIWLSCVLLGLTTLSVCRQQLVRRDELLGLHQNIDCRQLLAAAAKVYICEPGWVLFLYHPLFIPISIYMIRYVGMIAPDYYWWEGKNIRLKIGCLVTSILWMIISFSDTTLLELIIDEGKYSVLCFLFLFKENVVFLMTLFTLNRPLTQY